MKWLYLFLLGGYVLVNAQEIVSFEAVQDSILNQLTLFPQEKIHLHTDRTMYVPGEKIWFKAYVVDATTHLSPTYSQYVYVELISSSDSLVHRVMVNGDENGMFYGHIFLSELIPEGDYTLRAYTHYMENQGDDYFFRKNIRIDNLKSAAKKTGRQSRSNYDVSFFPEGGNLVEGVHNRVAFKALNQQGVSEFITGELVDKEGDRLGEVTTVFAGMGSFFFIPKAGKEYFLICKNSSGQEKRFKLPPAQKTFTLGTSYRNKRHFIQVKKSPDIPDRPLFLLVHCKGEVYHFASWNHRSEFISLSGDGLPSGVIQAVLFDEQMNPISERLIFNKNEDQANLVYSSDKPYYEKREKITSEIYVTDAEENPLAGHISVAVTDDRDIAIDTLHTITTSLLLSSELKGTIESPGYYLQDNVNAAYALDHLMMTHGWRRYAIPDAIKGNYTRPEILFEMSKEISGSVKSLLFGRPVVKGEVMFFSNKGDLAMTETDSVGSFQFFYHYPDSVRFFVQAKNQKGREGVELVLNEVKFPNPKHMPLSQTDKEIQPADVASDFIAKAGQRAQYDEDMRLIQLSEVTVTAKRIDKKDEVRLSYWMNSSSDKTIYHEEIEKRHVLYVTHLLYGVAGVQVNSNGEITIRGAGSFNGSTNPLVLIDGIPMEWPEKITSIYESPLEMVSVYDIESMDIFKGPSAAIFGMRGSNGAISITTRRGEASNSSGNYRPNFASFVPFGYQMPVEFYAPKYDTPESINLTNPDYRTTIYWKPDVIVNDDGKALFEFYTSDFPTTYSVVIEGLSNDGKIIRQVETLEVR